MPPGDKVQDEVRFLANDELIGGRRSTHDAHGREGQMSALDQASPS
jgi:hypothetical protein